ncbi:MAG: hypothetical protein ACRC6V_09455 [Bacteroidales bacterium]
MTPEEFEELFPDERDTYPCGCCRCCGCTCYDDYSVLEDYEEDDA